LTYEEMCNLIGDSFHWRMPAESVQAPGSRDENGPQGLTVTLFGSTLGVETTAFTSEDVMAATFNTELLNQVGNIIANDCLAADVVCLYGPGANIHRTPYGGRNFEYYSEDPLLSGKMAAAVTQGVQAHPGCGVTIKHFAANNQETNRYGNNSAVSERALREIYLKGFEICIRESDPMALMTSYNLINGTHTSESRELVTALLRDEYGFDGLVMTDWVVGGGLLLQRGSKYGMPDAAKVAASGHSLFMPGSRKDLREVMAGLKDGTITGKQLISNASWLLHVADRLGK
jgi:beta-glucosidase